MLKSSLKILQSLSFISASGFSVQWRSSVPALDAFRRSSASAYLTDTQDRSISFR